MAIVIETIVGGTKSTPTATPTASSVPVSNGSGKLASGWGGAASSLATLDANTRLTLAERGFVTGRAAAQTAANASVATFSVGGSDASFIVSANVLITAVTNASFNVTVSYTDESTTSRTTTFTLSQPDASLHSTLTNATGANTYQGIPLHIRCKASTSITIATSGTFTDITYNVEGAIYQVA